MKSYKIVRIAGLHYSFLVNYLNKSLANYSYYSLKKELFDQFYVYSDSFSHAMNSIGHQCDELVYDFKLLQIKWAEENSFKYSKKTWLRDILLAQIKAMKPDLLYFQDVHALSSEDFYNLKDYFPFIKKIIIFRGYPGLDKVSLKKIASADIVLVGSPILRTKLRYHKIASHLVYHYFDDRILQKIPCSQKKHDLTFIGTSGYGYGAAYLPRYLMLDELLKKTRIQLWLDETGQLKKNHFKSKVREVLKFLFGRYENIFKLARHLRFSNKLRSLFDEIESEKRHLSGLDVSYPLKPLSKKYNNRCFNPVFGLGMYNVLAGSKITLNRHPFAAENFSDNIRMFQATGMRCCLVTEKSKNINQLFEEDTEVVTYSSNEECIEKIKYLLQKEEICKSIAQKGHEKTLRFHTAVNRAEKINDILQSSD